LDHAPRPRIGDEGQPLHWNALHKLASGLENVSDQVRVLGKKENISHHTADGFGFG
jgi:hypothetical protein